MKRNRLVLALLVASILPVSIVHADGSEKETPREEQEMKPSDMEMPEAVIEHMAYLEYLAERYPDVSKVDVKLLLEQEGEKAALLYCKAIGFDGPCTINEEKNETQFRAVSPELIGTKSGDSTWWSWLNTNNFISTGVIPEKRECSSIPYAPRPIIEIHMDDEDRRNGNSRWGWLGATTSDRNTTWRYCRIDSYNNADFKPLYHWNKDADYAVLKLGGFCPEGSRTIERFQDNEDVSTANGHSGNIYPNVLVNGKNWLTYYCHFDSGSYSPYGYMSAFPDVGFSYGVFASDWMPRSIAKAYGFVYQDDEDFWNRNWWAPNPTNTAVMGDSRNTWRKLIKVR